MYSTNVIKFGGSSLATVEHIKKAALLVKKHLDNNEKIIVVVSAMGNTTNDLVQLAKQVSISPSQREFDMLLTAGERISMSLFAIALEDLKIPSISFTGSQAGIMTCGKHSSARIQSIKPVRLNEELVKGTTIVLAGFQGVNPDTKEITTLGRGGSDTTAVAMASHFQSHHCTMYKDVDGVFSADPKIVPTAKKIDSLSFKQLREMCFYGAKILHLRAVELAESLNVPLQIGSSISGKVGTIISTRKDDDNMLENNKIIAINSHKEVLHLNIKSQSMNKALESFKNFLKNHELSDPQLLASAADKEYVRLMITAPTETLIGIKQHTNSHIQLMDKDLCSITITATNNISLELIEAGTKALSEKGIAIDKTLTSTMSASFYVPTAQHDLAVQTLHQAFIK